MFTGLSAQGTFSMSLACRLTGHAVEQLRAEIVDVHAVVLQTLAEVLLPHADATAALHACGAVRRS